MRKHKFSFMIIVAVLVVSGAGYFATTQNLKEKEMTLQGNALEKFDLVRVHAPLSNSMVKSPLLVQGQARGVWFFEASFPVSIVDGNGNVLGRGIAKADADWMTEKFVPFQTIVEFKTPITKEGTLVLEKDNPSGLAEHDNKLYVLVRFK